MNVWVSRFLYGAGGSAIGAAAGIGLGIWGDQIDWTIVGFAAGGGFVVGFLGGNSALKWLMDTLDWS